MKSLNEKEYDAVWDCFEERFCFKPSVSGPFPAIEEPKCSITYRLKFDYDDAKIDELQSSIARAFVKLVSDREQIYYLDWQHECYRLSASDLANSFITGFPDGDYAILLSSNMDFGTFGHPWESSLCIFGEEFVELIIHNKPKILGEILRSKGVFA